MEIERKFTITALPDNLTDYKSYEIEQAYLCKHPVVRIRRKNDKYILTYKNREGIHLSDNPTAAAADEIEMPLNEAAFNHLKEKADGNVIHKTRYIIPIENNLKIELDVFHGALEGLKFAEVEFPTEEEAAAFTMPSWFLKDVTFDERYRNSNIAKMTDLSAYDQL